MLEGSNLFATGDAVGFSGPGAQRGSFLSSGCGSIDRTSDLAGRQRLGKDDHIVRWPKPRKPRSIDSETYSSLPDYLTVREIRVRVEQPGFRTRSVIVVTTLLDPEEFSMSDL